MEQRSKNSSRTPEQYWQEFLQTGSVKAYLEYKRQANRSAPPRP